MNYSTFDLRNFYIKKDSTLPELKFPLVQQLREQYNITDKMLENVAVTFSMIDAETGLYRIANTAADLVISNLYHEEKYTLVYKFKLHQTSKTGRFLGEFKVDFLQPDCENKMTFPTQGYINIVISDGITKTTVV